MNTKRTQVILSLSALFLALLTFACSSADEDSAAHAPLPESVETSYTSTESGAVDHDGYHVSELSYCHAVQHAHSLVLARIDERDQYMGPCEDRPAPRPFSDVTFSLIDNIAGEPLPDTFEARSLGTSIRFGTLVEVGDFAIVRIRTFGGELFVSGAIPVAFDEAGLDAIAPPPGTDHVWAFPTNNYEEFRTELADTWEDFEHHCPDFQQQNHWESWTESEMHSAHFGEPICADYSEPANQGEVYNTDEPVPGSNSDEPGPGENDGL